MITARESFAATTLQNGNVLITGGASTATAELYNPGTGAFTATGNMNQVRSGNTATLLASGMVLIAGGGSTSATEVYNPATGAFAAGPSMSANRSSFSATLLSNGNVLLAGGTGGSGSADLYNTGTNAISAVGNLNFPRFLHTGTLLANGQVLVVGGEGTTTYPASAELYDPTTATFTIAASLNQTRAGQTATLLSNDSVLIAGGYSEEVSGLDSFELYNPTSAVFTMNDLLMITGRAFQTQTQLPDGRVLVTGGFDPNSNVLASAEVYSPTTGHFAATGNMSLARQGHTATLLNSGQVLIAGGASTATGAPLASSELWDPTTGTFTLSGNMINSLEDHAAVLLSNGEVLISGGQTETDGNPEPAPTEQLYDPATGTFAATGSMGYTESFLSSVLLSNGQVLDTFSWAIAAGEEDDLYAQLYDPTTGVFQATGNSPSTPQGPNTLTALPNGDAYVGSGLNYSEVYDPTTGLFSSAAGFSEQGTDERTSHVAALLPNGQVLTAGGLHPPPIAWDTTSELYDPVSNTFEAGDYMRSPRVSPTASVLQNGNVLILGGTSPTLGDNWDTLYTPTGLRTVEIYVSPLSTPAVTVTSVTPTVLTGFSPVVLTVNGTGFVTSAAVSIDGAPLPTTYVSATEVTATVSVSEMVDVGTHQITVSNLGGQPSAPVSISIQNPLLDFSGVPVNFGTVMVGTSSAAQTITVTSGGNLAADLSSISLAGASPGSFSISSSSTCPLGGISLAPEAACTIVVVFTPTANGTATAQIEVPTNSYNSPTIISLTGIGSGLPGAAIYPATLYFVGDAGLPQDALLTNNGGAALNITSITTADTTHFTTINNCGASLAPGASCLMNVVFTPTANGTVNSNISIADNAPGSPQTIALTGTSGPDEGPGATVSPGVLYSAGLVTLSNTGNSTLAISSIAMNTPYYVDTNNCGTSLAAGASCTIDVSSSTVEGALPANPALSITDNAVGSPQTVALDFSYVSGEGPDYGDAVVQVTPASLTFFRSGGPAQVITVSNPQPPNLYFSGATLSTNANFSVSNNCPAILYSSASCQITVSFVSGPVGTVTNSVIIGDNAGGPQVIPITGTNPAAAGAGSGDGGAELLLGASSESLTSATVTSGQTASFNLQAVQLGAGSATVALSVNCSSVPGSTCGASPGSITVSPTGATAFSVSVATTTYTKATAPDSSPGTQVPPLSGYREFLSIFAALLALLLVSLLAARRFGVPPARWIATTAATMLLVIACGCAGSGTGTAGGGGSGTATGTPSGTYTVTVTANVQGVTQTLNLTLTVQ
jgi:hypothetical protein